METLKQELMRLVEAILITTAGRPEYAQYKIARDKLNNLSDAEFENFAEECCVDLLSVTSALDDLAEGQAEAMRAIATVISQKGFHSMMINAHLLNMALGEIAEWVQLPALKKEEVETLKGAMDILEKLFTKTVDSSRALRLLEVMSCGLQGQMSTSSSDAKGNGSKMN